MFAIVVSGDRAWEGSIPGSWTVRCRPRSIQDDDLPRVSRHQGRLPDSGPFAISRDRPRRDIFPANSDAERRDYRLCYSVGRSADSIIGRVRVRVPCLARAAPDLRCSLGSPKAPDAIRQRRTTSLAAHPPGDARHRRRCVNVGLAKGGCPGRTWCSSWTWCRGESPVAPVEGVPCRARRKRWRY
jgi:hypothetical protein